MNQNDKKQQNPGTTNPLPRNVLRVDFAKKLVGIISRGHANVGIAVARDHKLRDKFDDNHFIFQGVVYVRVTNEVLDALRKESAYESYVLSMEIVKDSVRAELSLGELKSKTDFNVSCLTRVRNFLNNGKAMGNVIARFLDGANPQDLIDAARRNHQRPAPKQSKQSPAQAALAALGKAKSNGNHKANRNSGKPRGNQPGGMGTLGDVAGDKLEGAKKEMSRKQAQKHGDDKAKKKAEAPELTPETTPVVATAPAALPQVSPDVIAEISAPKEAQVEEKPTLRMTQIRTYAQGLARLKTDDERAEFLSRISSEANRLAVLKAEAAMRDKENATVPTVH